MILRRSFYVGLCQHCQLIHVLPATLHVVWQSLKQKKIQGSKRYFWINFLHTPSCLCGADSDLKALLIMLEDASSWLLYLGCAMSEYSTLIRPMKWMHPTAHLAGENIFVQRLRVTQFNGAFSEVCCHIGDVSLELGDPGKVVQTPSVFVKFHLHWFEKWLSKKSIITYANQRGEVG